MIEYKILARESQALDQQVLMLLLCSSGCVSSCTISDTDNNNKPLFTIPLSAIGMERLL